MARRYEFSLQYPKPLDDEDLEDLLNIARSGSFSRYGSDYVVRLEAELAAYYQSNHGVTCTSGTAALQGCIVALDLPPGSEVIMTPLADIGIVLPVIYENLRPVFADVDPTTYNISAETVERQITPLTVAVIAVHLAGNPCDLDGLRELCDNHNLILIEDFSQAHGATWDKQKVGSHGHMGFGSFQQGKQITCGEGGVILTDDADLARRAFIGVDKGWQRDLPLEDRFYEFLAPNVRFNALQAAVLRPQLKRLDSLVSRKRAHAATLYALIEPHTDSITPQRLLDGAEHAYYSFPLFVGDQVTRDKLLRTLDEKYNVYAAYGYANPKTLYMGVNALIDPERYGRGLAYSSRTFPAGICPQAEDLLNRSLLIPFNENFSDDEVKEVGERLISAVLEVCT